MTNRVFKPLTLKKQIKIFTYYYFILILTKFSIYYQIDKAYYFINSCWSNQKCGYLETN